MQAAGREGRTLCLDSERTESGGQSPVWCLSLHYELATLTHLLETYWQLFFSSCLLVGLVLYYRCPSDRPELAIFLSF